MNGSGLLPAFVALGVVGVLVGYSRAAKASVNPDVLTPTSPTGIDALDTIVVEGQRTDFDTMARTIWGEARGEGYAGMQAVANVIMNRLAVSLRTPGPDAWGNSIREICLAPRQFSAWLLGDPNRAAALRVTPDDLQFRMAQELTLKAMGGLLPDLTFGAVNYHAAGIFPSWADASRRTAAIGNHVFYG